LPINIPLKELLVEAALNALNSPFATRRKRSGDSGHPYLITLSGLKKGEAAPFINNAKEIKLKQPITNATKSRLKPRWMRRR
jgi:hypothetical protein